MEPKTQIHLSGYLDIPAERWEDIRAALPAHIVLSRKEPGCLSFDVTEDETVPMRLWVQESFQDRPSFDAHQIRMKSSPWAKVSAGIPRHYQITEVAV